MNFPVFDGWRVAILAVSLLVLRCRLISRANNQLALPPLNLPPTGTSPQTLTLPPFLFLPPLPLCAFSSDT
jgi:hypothetical protein